jgi:hypothetical protein
MSIRTFIIATAAAGGLALVPAGAAGAASTSETPREVFQQLCEAKGGLPVFSPYAIGRCQDARANKGFDAEQQYCESLGDAEFSFTISTRHMNRANWVCTSTVPVR